MPFESPGRTPARVAIVGAGIAGLGAAHRLAERCQVTLFEAEPRLGGHARTVMAGRGTPIAVDTGFIVFNRHTYPNLCALFEAINAPVKKSDMSFSACIDGGRIEYGVHDLATLFAQQRNLLRPSFLRMAADIARFNRIAAKPDEGDGVSLGQWLAANKFGEGFRDNYILPLAGAIWSASPAQMLSFPAQTLLGFFRNHHLLSLTDRIEWWTLDGGSREYVSRLEASLRTRGVSIRLGAPVAGVRRSAPGAEIVVRGEAPEAFDAVVLACHADQALAMLADPAEDETRVLGALRYSKARVVLHDDVRQMPRRRACWASWNALRDSKSGESAVTYWMNKLQSLPESTPLFATLNPLTPIPDERVFDAADFSHPIFDRAAIEAQGALPALQGVRDTYFCGAYARHGFHEDGLASGLAAANRLLERATP